jgi:hypothetical protein
MTTQQNYQETVAVYTVQMRSLFTLSEDIAVPQAVTRGERAIPAETLAERSEKLTEISRRLGEMTTDYLEADGRVLGEAAEMKLLAQATAEFEVARALLEIAENEARGTVSARTTRASRTAAIGRSINELTGVLETPLEAGMQPFMGKPAHQSERRPTDIEQPGERLQDEVDKTLRRISHRAGTVGWHAARDLLLMDTAALVQGVALISQDAAQLLDRAVAGLAGLALRLASSALRLLLHAYEWVLALLGKDTEQQALSQVKHWLDELVKEQKDNEQVEGIFENIVDRLYNVQAIKSEVTGWLKDTQADMESLTKTAEIVIGLAEKYRVKTDQVERFLKVVTLSKKVPLVNTPYGQLITSAVTLGLLGYVLYAGYDHVDSGRVVFSSRFGFSIPDPVQGVRKTVQKALGVA